jgi:hypothetical protein
MLPSRGMGAIRPSKMNQKHPRMVVARINGRRGGGQDSTSSDKEGAQRFLRSRVNEAGNYTKPGLWQAQFLSGSKQVVKVVLQGNGAPARHKCWLSSTKNLEEVIVINIEDFRLKTIPFIPAFKHRQDCLVMQDGPCTCGLEEVLEDEAREEYESASEES